MSHILDRFVVVLDANVLYPFRKRDIFLTFFKMGLFRARWTEQIITEWVENLVKNKPEAEMSVQSQVTVMREHFRDAWVTDYESLISALVLPDTKDRHVLAAAIRCGAQHIVTENVRDFPEEYLEQFDIHAIESDEFLSRTFELYQADALLALKAVRARYENPPYTPSEFTLDLIAKGLPKLAARVRPHRDFI